MKPHRWSPGYTWRVTNLFVVQLMRRLRLTPLFAAIALAGAACVTDPSQPSVPAEEEFADFLEVDIPTMVKVSDDLYYKDIHVGTGSPAAAFNKTIAVTYSGYLKNGVLFDSNVGSDSLVTVLNDSQVIAGWVLGISGMKPGGIRKLVIGSQLAYGSVPQERAGSPTIPAHSTLVFNVRLIQVK